MQALGQAPCRTSRHLQDFSELFIQTAQSHCAAPRRVCSGLWWRGGLEMKRNIFSLKRRGIVSAVLKPETWL